MLCESNHAKSQWGARHRRGAPTLQLESKILIDRDAPEQAPGQQGHAHCGQGKTAKSELDIAPGTVLHKHSSHLKR
jgi:hypothetical protein